MTPFRSAHHDLSGPHLIGGSAAVACASAHTGPFLACAAVLGAFVGLSDPIAFLPSPGISATFLAGHQLRHHMSTTRTTMVHTVPTPGPHQAHTGGGSAGQPVAHHSHTTTPVTGHLIPTRSATRRAQPRHMLRNHSPTARHPARQRRGNGRVTTRPPHPHHITHGRAVRPQRDASTATACAPSRARCRHAGIPCAARVSSTGRKRGTRCRTVVTPHPTHRPPADCPRPLHGRPVPRQQSGYRLPARCP